VQIRVYAVGGKKATERRERKVFGWPMGPFLEEK
jgi:hypothetical protein